MPKLYKAIRVCLINQFIGLVTSIPVYYAMVWRSGGVQSTAEELPTFTWVLFELCVFILVEEVGFYYTHRYVCHLIFNSGLYVI